MSLRFGWVGSTRRSHLVEVVRGCVTAWLEEWSAAPDVSSVQLEETVVVPLSPDEARVIRIGPEEARWMLAIGTDDQRVLGNWLAGVETVDGEALAGQVAIEALRDLVAQLAACAGHADAPEDHGQGPWPAGAVRGELGAVGIRVTIGAASLVLACERAVVDAISPCLASVASTPALVERQASIGNASVEIAAVLDFGSMSAPELFDLQVGEVLIGECTLDTPTRLIATGAVLLAQAAMYKTGDRRSVALLKTSNTQEKQ
jgi:hypothetical protein